jgi:hypothetical protein
MHPFLAHLIGDFILQNEWMATNKKRSSVACVVHTLSYLIPFLGCDLRWWQIAVIGIQHFVQDRSEFVLWWMRVWKRAHPESWIDLPLYVDQVFHLVWIQFVIWLGTL